MEQFWHIVMRLLCAVKPRKNEQSSGALPWAACRAWGMLHPRRASTTPAPGAPFYARILRNEANFFAKNQITMTARRI